MKYYQIGYNKYYQIGKLPHDISIRTLYYLEPYKDQTSNYVVLIIISILKRISGIIIITTLPMKLLQMSKELDYLIMILLAIIIIKAIQIIKKLTDDNSDNPPLA